MNLFTNQIYTLIRWLLMALCLAFSASAQSNNEWRPLAPLEGCTVNTLLEKEGIVYAGTSNTGIFISGDNGQRWREANQGLTNLIVNALATAGGNLLAATNSGIYRSSDGGQNWTLAGLKNQQVFCFAVTSVGVFAGSDLYRVYRSNDNGQSWIERGRTPVSLGASVTALAWSGETLIAGTSLGVCRSTNQGQSWVQVTTGLPNAGFADTTILLVNGNTVYLATRIAYISGRNYLPQVYSSNDSGQSWTAVGAAISATLNSTIADSPGIKSLAFDGTTLTALTTYGVFTFDGQAWQEAKGGSGLPVGMSVNALTRSGGKTLLGTEGGIFVATEQRWNQSNTGLTAAAVSALAVSGDVIIASAGASGLFRSDNDGQSWSAITSVSNRSGRSVMVKTLAARGNNVLAGTDWGGVFRSTDNGTNWNQLDAGLRLVYFAPDVAFSGPAETDAAYALSWGFVHRLNPNGSGWTVLYGDAEQLRPRSRLAVNGSNVYVATDRYVVRSTDGGVNYTAVNTAAQVSSSRCIFARDNQVFFGGEAFNPNVGSENRIFISTDNGGSFTTSRSLLSANAIVAGTDTLYAATGTDGVYFSKNQGTHWTPINAGLAMRGINALAVKGEMVLAGTNGRGVFVARNPHLQPANLATVSAASYRAEAGLARTSIASAFGTALANDTVAAATTPLPVALQGTRILVRDSAGTERYAPLFFVSPTQINYQIPTATALGEATVMVLSGDGSSAFGTVPIVAVAPGLFAANANGQGVSAAVVIRVRSDGTQSIEPVAQFDATQNRFIAVPIDLGAESDQVFLALYGTGVRARSSLSATTVIIGGTDAPVTFAGAQGQFIGLDQINVRLPRSLAGRGELDIQLTVDGKPANLVRVNIK